MIVLDVRFRVIVFESPYCIKMFLPVGQRAALLAPFGLFTHDTKLFSVSDLLYLQ